MDDSLIDLAKSITPKFNRKIVDGWVLSEIDECLNEVDMYWRMAIGSLSIPLTYHGYEVCTPKEEYERRSRRINNAFRYDISRSNLYLVKYFLKYNNEKLADVYLNLPFVEDGGVYRSSGSQFQVTPVIGDKIFSPGVNEVFMAISRAKVTFRKINHPIVVDGEGDSAQVVWSKLYNTKTGSRAAMRILPTLAHYLFCRYGVTETFKRYANADVIVGTHGTITRQKYPVEDWVLCKSTGIPMLRIGRTRQYMSTQPSNIVIAIKRSEFNHTAKSLVGGFYYVVDHFPDQVDAQWVDHTNKWLILIGLINKPGDVSYGILQSNMANHLASLEEYVDAMIKRDLEILGIEAKDFFDILGMMIRDFSSWVRKSESTINSMYGKELYALRNMLYPIKANINKMAFRFQATAGKELRIKEVESIIATHIKPGCIYRCTKEGRGITSFQFSGSNKALKLTTSLMEQTQVGRLKKQSTVSTDDPAKKIHVSVAEVGGAFIVAKSDPSGRSRINPYVRTNAAGMTEPHPDLIPLLERVQNTLKT